MAALAQDAVQAQFSRDGFYVHVAPVLAPETLSRAAEGLEAVRAGRFDTGEAPAGGAVAGVGADPRALTKIEQPQIASAALRQALCSPRLGELAAAVTGASRVQVWWVQGLVKPGTPDAPLASNVGWHQDKTYWSAREDGSELFTAWLALSDVTADAGPMVFVPGSHRWGLLPGGDFYGQDQDALRAAIRIPAGEEWREVADVLPPGGVSFHHQMLFHGSHQNRSDRPRRSLAIHLRTERSSPKPDAWVANYLDRPEICPVIYDAGK